MHCALQRRRNNTRIVSDTGKGSLLRKSSKLNNFKTSSEVKFWVNDSFLTHTHTHMGISGLCRAFTSFIIDLIYTPESFVMGPQDSEEASLAWRRNSDQRFCFLTFFTLQPDGQWKMIALPLQCCNRSNLEHGGNGKVDGLHLVSHSMSSFKVDCQNAQRSHKKKGDPSTQGSPQTGHHCDNIFSIIPHKTRSFSASHVQRQSQNKASKKGAVKLNELSSETSCQNFAPATDSPGLRLNGSDGTNSSDMSIDNSKVNKVVKKNARKKTRKKGKQKKKHSSESVSALEVNSEGGLLESLIPQTCANNDLDHGDGFNSSTTAPSVSPSECRANGSNSEGGDSNNVIDCSEIPTECASFIDEADASEGVLPSLLPNYTSEHCVDNSENGLKTRDPLSSEYGGEEGTCCKPTSYYDDSCSKVLSEMPDSLVLDSISIGWNSDGSATAAADDKPFNGGRDGISSSELPIYSNSSDIRFIPPGKRGKQGGRAHRNSSVYQACSAGNSHGRAGKETNHSVWQKVQKGDATAGCDFEMKKANPGCAELDVTLKGSNIAESILSKPENKYQSKAKASRKLKRKTSPGSKQDYKCHSRKGSQTIKASSNACSTSNLQQNEVLSTRNEVNSRKGLGSSVLQIGAPKVGPRTKRSIHDGMHIRSDGLEPQVISAINNRTAETQNSSCLKLRDPIRQSDMLEVESSVDLSHPVDNEVSGVDKGVHIAECGSQDPSSGSVLQKWIPVGLKEAESMNFGKSESSSFSRMEDPSADDDNLRKIVGEDFLSTSQSIGGQNSSSVHDGQIQNLVNKNTYAPKGQENKHVSANSSVFESNVGKSALATDPEKIARAVDDAIKVRIVSEAVQMTTGSPIAEFERFLYSASPVIRQSLCKRETPSVSLGSLWEWYEKHGSYGLEVRAEDYENSKRLGADRFAFRAYFVPFLSAVQLFGNRKSCPKDDNKGIHGVEASQACEMVEMSEGSDVGRLSIFSVLIPQPCTKQTNISPVTNHVLPGDEISLRLDDTKWSDDSELLFEYFEYEPPQHRRPLYEKIQELVKGDGHCQAFGDPTRLDSMDLRDLHPRSWYSVAWYPIYKIPDGNFRAAFLTYHSLGHLGCRSATTDVSCSTDVSIVSPVVGLQSYNAQGESWFQLKHCEASQVASTPTMNASEILKERLRTLEETASLMARAAVSKGKLTSVNRHPDYEFFLSRRR